MNDKLYYAGQCGCVRMELVSLPDLWRVIRYNSSGQWHHSFDGSKGDCDIYAISLAESLNLIDRLVEAGALAYRELNTIRARDGAPAGVDPQYFSNVVDDLDTAILVASGHSAHCHPSLYR